MVGGQIMWFRNAQHVVQERKVRLRRRGRLQATRGSAVTGEALTTASPTALNLHQIQMITSRVIGVAQRPVLPRSNQLPLIGSSPLEVMPPRKWPLSDGRRR
jgi:hypothetical protein